MRVRPLPSGLLGMCERLAAPHKLRPNWRRSSQITECWCNWCALGSEEPKVVVRFHRTPLHSLVLADRHLGFEPSSESSNLSERTMCWRSELGQISGLASNVERYFDKHLAEAELDQQFPAKESASGSNPESESFGL